MTIQEMVRMILTPHVGLKMRKWRMKKEKRKMKKKKLKLSLWLAVLQQRTSSKKMC